MTELSEKIYQDCITNYSLVLRKFKIIKSTPKDIHHVFLPLTKAETITAWQAGIDRYEKDINNGRK